MWKLFNRLFIILFIVIGIFYFYDQLSRGIYDRLLIGFAIIPVLFGPWIISKLFHYQLGDVLQFCYYAFAFLGLILGSILRFYQLYPGYDKFVHFISGVITAVVALLFLKKSGTNTAKTPLWFQIFFLICFSLAIAGIWEFFEFFCDHITGGDCQYVVATGVHDTMEDMLVAFLGSILFGVYYYFEMRRGKNNRIQQLEKYF